MARGSYKPTRPGAAIALMPSRFANVASASDGVHEMYRVMIEHTPEAVLIFDGEIVSVANKAAANLFAATSPRDLITLPIAALIDDAFYANIFNLLERAPTEHVAMRMERAIRRLDGSTAAAELSVVALDVNGTRMLHLIVRDNQERKNEAALERDRRRVCEMVAHKEPLAATLAELARLVENQCRGTLCAVYLEDETRLILCAAPTMHADLVERVRELEIGSASSVMGTSSFRHETAIALDLDEDVVLSKVAGDLAMHDLRTVWAMPIISGQGGRFGVLALFSKRRDRPSPAEQHVLTLSSQLATIAIDHRKLIDQLAHQARHDVLTGLPNRTMFEDRLHQALAHARRNQTLVGVLFINLDRFNTVNESLGHSMGDALLQKIALRLRNRVRGGDTLARMGADEFTLVAAALKRSEDAILVARKVQDALREPFEVAGHELFVTASIGISVYPQDGDDAATLHRAANAASHDAKLAGASSFRCFTHAMNASAQRRMRIETELRRAVDRQELTLAYQPQVELATGRVVSCEALVRWDHAELGKISPVEFIPIAEETGIIEALGEQVLSLVCQQIRYWIDQNLVPLPVAVNVSALQFASPELVNKVARILRDNTCPPELIELELTETTIMQNIGDSRARVDALRELGIRISIDDFGTGYSSLAYLQQLPLDSLKVDRSFVHEIRDLGPRSDQARALVQTIVALGHSLGVHVVAEGIENEVQGSFLRQIGCHRGQGYHFSKPVPPDRFVEYLRALSLS
ncbi:MAG: EAL domain-containing protein [Clostridia bacterium]|nr:EAL domain-containing protein [Deltaproteobacteria bacterium]